MFETSITFPEKLLRSPRTHNKFVAAGVRAELEYHHKNRIPLRFEKGAYTRFGFMQRTAKYNAIKKRKFGHQLPLVYSGASMAGILANGRVTVSGSASDETIVGTLRMRFAFTGGTGRMRDPNSRRGVTPAQMIKELRTMPRYETAESSQRLREDYLARISST